MNEVQEWRATADWPYSIAAGGVVFRECGDGKIEVAVLVREQPSKDYNLPKGGLHHNETLENCARREILEESGKIGEIVGYLGALQDNFLHPGLNIQLDRTVHYFAMKFVSENSEHDSEHDSVEWRELNEARQLLFETMAIKREFLILDRFKEFMEKFDKEGSL
ncbi:NUDIX domain-containing protein [Candidatus Saccharibacteria bacterium]|nr:NUDIX domain-containing protein [Candidatus Saccharibacteria bacterium]